MAHIKPDNDAVRRSQKLRDVLALKEYIDTLAPIFYNDYQNLVAHLQTITEPKTIEDDPQIAARQLEVYNTVKSLDFTVNPETFTVGIKFSDDSGFGCHIENVDIDSQQFCFGFMVFLNSLTYRIMGAMQYHIPTGWCKVEIWKALKTLRTRADYIFDADQPVSHSTSKTKRTKKINQISSFQNYLKRQEVRYQTICQKNHTANSSIRDKRFKKYFKIYDTFETFRISQNPEQFTAEISFFGGTTDFMCGDVDIDSQVFCLGVMTFVNTLTYRIISALALDCNTVKTRQLLSATLINIQKYSIRMFSK